MGLCGTLIYTDNHGVVTLERLQCELFLWLDALFSELDNFSCEYSFW